MKERVEDHGSKTVTFKRIKKKPERHVDARFQMSFTQNLEYVHGWFRRCRPSGHVTQKIKVEADFHALIMSPIVRSLIADPLMWSRCFADDRVRNRVFEESSSRAWRCLGLWPIGCAKTNRRCHCPRAGRAVSTIHSGSLGRPEPLYAPVYIHIYPVVYRAVYFAEWQ